MSVPITLSCTDYTKDAIESSSKKAVALVTQMGETVAILRDPEIYENRKEEIVTRMFGVIDRGHPYIKKIYEGGDWLIGGEVELLDRIKYNDGLDEWRKTAKQVRTHIVSLRFSRYILTNPRFARPPNSSPRSSNRKTLT